MIKIVDGMVTITNGNIVTTFKVGDYFCSNSTRCIGFVLEDSTVVLMDPFGLYGPYDVPLSDLPLDAKPVLTHKQKRVIQGMQCAYQQIQAEG